MLQLGTLSVQELVPENLQDNHFKQLYTIFKIENPYKYLNTHLQHIKDRKTHGSPLVMYSNFLHYTIKMPKDTKGSLAQQDPLTQPS